MTPQSLETAGVILVTVPAIAFGGTTLLRFLGRGTPGYADNPLRSALFRAGHAHAGVLVILALVGLLYVDAAALGPVADAVVRIGLVLPPILMPAGMFLSVASPRATRPNALIALVYVGAAALVLATATLGIGLLR